MEDRTAMSGLAKDLFEGKPDQTALSGVAKRACDPDPIQEVAEEISSSLKSKDLTVQQALWALDRARDLLMESKVI
jgi:hypothetical protein